MVASKAGPSPKKRLITPKTNKQPEKTDSMVGHMKAMMEHMLQMFAEQESDTQASKKDETEDASLSMNNSPPPVEQAQPNPEEMMNSNAVKRKASAQKTKLTPTTPLQTIKRLYQPPAVSRASENVKNNDLTTRSSSTDSKVERDRPSEPTTSVGSSPRDKSPETRPLTVAKETTKNPRLLQFDGHESTLKKWIDDLESVRAEHGWDEVTLIHNMKKNLEQVPLQWLIQEDDNISWSEWKSRLMAKWRWTAGLDRVERLQSFVNIYRHPNENIIDFYYRKLNLGQHCELNDYMICQIIIQRLRNPYLEEGAYKAKCTDTYALLKYLEGFKYAGVKESKYHVLQCSYCDGRGHVAHQCLGYCKYCRKRGHKSQVCRYRFNTRQLF